MQGSSELQPLIRLAIWYHASTPLCTQQDGRPTLPDILQPCLGDVAAEVHPDLHQAVAMDHHSLQHTVSDPDTVLQAEEAQPPAAPQHSDHILVSDMSTARQGQAKQVGAPVAELAVSQVEHQSLVTCLYT